MVEGPMTHPPLELCFIWHMHQPDYRDESGQMTMPWVFLHAIKDYYEMPWHLMRFSQIRATFNLTATLIEQLELCADPVKNDRFFSRWILPPERLDADERANVVRLCRSAQFETMVRPLRRFEALYHKKTYSDAELLELEVLFVLAWCSQALRRENPVVRELVARGEGFTQHDKERLLETLSTFVEGILPYYAECERQGRIALSTTPYNHPILPLLLDVENARRADPETTLPEAPLSLRDDAVAQIEKAQALFRRVFGHDPAGFWPAEGAVDEASAELYRKHGIGWIATDEAILFRSLGSGDRRALYRPYRYNGLTVAFRDHGLSDLIGFTYRFKPAAEAAKHFIRALEPIAAESETTPTVFVILDGENAWEFYENNAFDFFSELYGRIESLPWCRTVTMDTVAGQTASALEKLAPGSWIRGDFSTWIGQPEKNHAWELIYQTKRDVALLVEAPFDAETSAAIGRHFLTAECSDWFWWYGDDHATDFAEEFDALFRANLIAIYRLAGLPPPADLLVPVFSKRSTADFLTEPQAPITPSIDGAETSFFEWLGSGRIEEHRLFSTMDGVRGPIERILFGHDDARVYVAFEGDVASLAVEEGYLSVAIEESQRHLRFACDRPTRGKEAECAFGERIELALSRSLFGGSDIVHLRFEIGVAERIVQTLPGYGTLRIDMSEDYARHWFV